MTLLSVGLIVAWIGAILLSSEIGYRLGIRHWRGVSETLRIVSPTVEASVFGLMGLLIAFTFYGAGSRFDNRRSLMGQEANAIGTAYLRLDLLPPAAQAQLRNDFHKYVQSRIAVLQALPDVDAVHAALDQSEAIQRRIWEEAVEAVKDTGPSEKVLVLASLNAMIDITTTQTVAFLTHPPTAIFILLGLTVLVCSALAGYEMAAKGMRAWVINATFAFVLGVAVYVTLDYEYPRAGIIRVDQFDQLLTETLKK